MPNNNQIQIFNNPEFGRVRVVEIDGEPWMVAKDVSQALGYGRSNDMVKHLDEDDYRKIKCGDLPHLKSAGNNDVTIISESGLHYAVIRSRLPEAKIYRRWVTSEVLPSIRKTGSYSVKSFDPDNIEDVLRVALESRIQLRESEQRRMESEQLRMESEQQVTDLSYELADIYAWQKDAKPKIDYYNDTIDEDGAIDMQDCAAALKLHIGGGKYMGRNALYKYLVKRGLLLKKDNGNATYYIPKKPFWSDTKLFRPVQRFRLGRGSQTGMQLPYCMTLVTEKGKYYIRKMWYLENPEFGDYEDENW